MPNWKKLLTSGSNIQISALTLDAAGVTKASIDTSGNIAASGNISSSGDIYGTRLNLTSAGVHKASIDASGNVAAEGFISSSGLLSGTSLDIKSAGVTKASIDTAGKITAGYIEGKLLIPYGNAVFAEDSAGNFNNVAITNLMDAGLIFGDDASVNTKIAGINTEVQGTGYVLVDGTTIKLGDGSNQHVTASGNINAAGGISSSGLLSGTSLDIRTNGVQKALISAGGSATISNSSTLKGHVYIGTHDGEKSLYIDKFNSGYPYAHIFAGVADNNTKVGIKLVTRRDDGTAENGLVIEGDTREATFANVVNATAINTGQGDNELYDMNQNVLTTSDVTFNTVTLTSDSDVGWHGSVSRVKILPSDFQPDSGGRPAMTFIEGNDAWLGSNGSGTLFASVPIPTGFKATHVKIHGSDTGQTFTVYEANIAVSTISTKGTATAIETEKAITNVNSTTTNFILIGVSSDGGSDQIHGGYMTIAPI